jgi:predicted nicotinamide N-methyase
MAMGYQSTFGFHDLAQWSIPPAADGGAKGKCFREISNMPGSKIQAYGVRLLRASHPRVRSLKKAHKPSEHGHKVWDSSWLLIDYLRETGAAANQRVLEIGCGWGLAAVYCAKNHSVAVTGADLDADVGPYLGLLAASNNVDVSFVNLDFDRIGSKLLTAVDLVIGTDICFCDSLIDPLRRLIQRAKKASVKTILISDPGRWPFDDLVEIYSNSRNAELLDWEIRQPHAFSGKILRIHL